MKKSKKVIPIHRAHALKKEVVEQILADLNACILDEHEEHPFMSVCDLFLSIGASVHIHHDVFHGIDPEDSAA